MKVAIDCTSPLLQKSLENFLEGHLSSIHSCDLILTDSTARSGEANILRIGPDVEADIRKPFSKAQLFLKLEQFYKTKEDREAIQSMTQAMDAEDAKQELLDSLDYSNSKEPLSPKELGSLEEKIERLTGQYIKGVMSLVKEHYGK